MKALFSLTLALVVLAAGCITTDDLAPAGVLPDAAAVTTTDAMVHLADGVLAPAPEGLARALGGQYPIGLPSTEPTIATTSDGAIYITANAANPSCDLAGGCPAIPYANFARGPTIMKSVDHGQTWTDVYPKLPTGDSEKLRTWDPYVYVDADMDRIFMDDIYPISCGSLAFSDDGGATWTRNPYACGNSHVNDHQTLWTGKPRVLPTVGYPNLVYRCVNNLAYIGCAISNTGGLSFLPQIPITSAMGQCGSLTGHGESDHEGRAYLGMGCGGKPSVAMTEDDGRSWTVTTIADKTLDDHNVELGIDEVGNVYALFTSAGLPWLSVSRDHAATWSEPRMVAAPGVTATKFVAIAAAAEGRIAFSYVGTTHPGGYDNPEPECGALPALPCTDPDAWADATWNGYIGTSANALDAEPVIQTVTANQPSDPLARGACADRCHGMTDFIEIVIDVEGRPWASFVDVCVAQCVKDPTVLHDGNIGFAGTLREGPALRGPAGALSALLAPPEVSA